MNYRCKWIFHSQCWRKLHIEARRTIPIIVHNESFKRLRFFRNLIHLLWMTIILVLQIITDNWYHQYHMAIPYTVSPLYTSTNVDSMEKSVLKYCFISFSLTNVKILQKWSFGYLVPIIWYTSYHSSYVLWPIIYGWPILRISIWDHATVLIVLHCTRFQIYY